MVDGNYQRTVLGEPFRFPANRENTYCLIQFLRGCKKPSEKQGLFSQEQIAQAIPDFDGKSRQGVDDHERRFRESDGNLRHYLTRQRKVDATVVDAVRAEVLECPMRQTADLVTAVNHQLGRDDLNADNIRAAVEQMSLAEVRPVLRRQFAQGRLHYKESYLLETMMRTLSPEAGELAGLSVSEPSGMGVSKLTNITQLLTPDVPVGDVAVGVFWLVFLMRLFVQGVPLRVLAQWCHVHPSTVLRWILGLALALWPQVNQWLVTSVTMKKAYVDEKWIKIRGTWYYWCVVLDADTGLPMYQELLASRSTASVSWIVTQ